jgi:hypothetical protein
MWPYLGVAALVIVVFIIALHLLLLLATIHHKAESGR